MDELIEQLRAVADKEDGVVAAVVGLAQKTGVDIQSILGRPAQQAETSATAVLIRKAADALTTMQAREATLIRERDALREALIDWRNTYLCPCSDIEESATRLLTVTDEALATSDLAED